MQKIIALLLLAVGLTLTTSCSEYFNLGKDPGDEQLMIQARQAYANQDYEASYKDLYHLANKNNKEALYALGYLYYYGLGVQENPRIAQDLIRQSADQGYKPAIKALRLFSATKSTFTVDNNNQSYIADYSPPPAKIKNKDNKKNHTKKNPSSVPITPIVLNISEENNELPTLEKEPKKLAYENTNTDLIEPLESFTKSEEKTDSVEVSNISSQVPKASNKITQDTNPVSTKNNVANVNDPVEKTYKLPNIKIFQSQDKINTKESLVAGPQIKKNTLTDNSWLNSQKLDNYTIQITTSKDKSEIEKFIIANNLKNKVNTFAYSSNNEVWYGAGYGVYDKPSEAYKALSEIPLNNKSKKPWVRQFRNIMPSAVG